MELDNTMIWHSHRQKPYSRGQQIYDSWGDLFDGWKYVSDCPICGRGPKVDEVWWESPQGDIMCEPCRDWANRSKE